MIGFEDGDESWDVLVIEMVFDGK